MHREAMIRRPQGARRLHLELITVKLRLVHHFLCAKMNKSFSGILSTTAPVLQNEREKRDKRKRPSLPSTCLRLSFLGAPLGENLGASILSAHPGAHKESRKGFVLSSKSDHLMFIRSALHIQTP